MGVPFHLTLLTLLAQGAAPPRPTIGRLVARFSYQTEGATQGCPTAAQMRREIQSGLDYDPFQPEAPLLLSIKIAPDDSRKGEGSAEVSLSDARGNLSGQQHIRADNADCQSLALSAALAARLALEPVVTGPAASAPEAHAVAGPPLGAVPPPEVHAEATSGSAAHRASVDGVIGVGPLVGFGAGVAPNWGLLLGGEMRWRHASLGLQVRADFPSSAALQVNTNASIQTALIAGILAPCGRLGGFAGCGLLALGREQSSGSGMASNETLNTFYGAAGIRLAYGVRPWHELGFALSGDLLVPFARTQLLVSGQPAWRTPPLSVAISIAVETWIQ